MALDRAFGRTGVVLPDGGHAMGRALGGTGTGQRLLGPRLDTAGVVAEQIAGHEGLGRTTALWAAGGAQTGGFDLH